MVVLFLATLHGVWAMDTQGDLELQELIVDQERVISPGVGHEFARSSEVLRNKWKTDIVCGLKGFMGSVMCTTVSLLFINEYASDDDKNMLSTISAVPTIGSVIYLSLAMCIKGGKQARVREMGSTHDACTRGLHKYTLDIVGQRQVPSLLNLAAAACPISDDQGSPITVPQFLLDHRESARDIVTQKNEIERCWRDLKALDV